MRNFQVEFDRDEIDTRFEQIEQSKIRSSNLAPYTIALTSQILQESATRLFRDLPAETHLSLRPTSLQEIDFPEDYRQLHEKGTPGGSWCMSNFVHIPDYSEQLSIFNAAEQALEDAGLRYLWIASGDISAENLGDAVNELDESGIPIGLYAGLEHSNGAVVAYYDSPARQFRMDLAEPDLLLEPDDAHILSQSAYDALKNADLAQQYPE